MDKKATNPKDALGIKKAPLHLVPTGPLYEVGLAMLEGGRKYGAHNYRAVGTRASVYYDAALRHINQWWEGEDIDAVSGIHHLMKAAACLFVQRDSQMMGNDVDDRPVKYTDGLCMDKLNEAASKLVESHKECAKPFTEKTKISEPGIGKSAMPHFHVNSITLAGFGAKLCRFADDLPSGEHMVEFCTCCKCGVRLAGANKDESYGGFTIKRPIDEDKGWYVFKANAQAQWGAKFLHKDLEVHDITGYKPGEHGPGEAPGYYMTKQEARKVIDAFNNKPVYSIDEFKYSGSTVNGCWYVSRKRSGKDMYLYPNLKWYKYAKNGNSDYRNGSYHPTKQIAQAYLDAYLEQEKQ